MIAMSVAESLYRNGWNGGGGGYHTVVNKGLFIGNIKIA